MGVRQPAGLPGSRKRLLHLSQSNWNCSLNQDVKLHAHLIFSLGWSEMPHWSEFWTEERKIIVFCSCWVNCSYPELALVLLEGVTELWDVSTGPWWLWNNELRRDEENLWGHLVAVPCTGLSMVVTVPYSQGHFLQCDYSLWFSFVLPTHALLFGLNLLNNLCTPYYSTWKAWKSSPSVTSYVDWIWAAVHCNQENANYLPNSL